jgi:formylglycine-generating enzyme required for sulfatase activity
MKIQQTILQSLHNLVIVSFCLTCMSTSAHAVKHGKTLKTSKAGTVFRDCRGCPEMVVIPAGRFEMGSPDSDEAQSDDEGPMHRVKIAAFALGKAEITRGQFAIFVKSTKYAVGNNCRTLEDGKFEIRSGRSWHDLGFLQNNQHPTCGSGLKTAMTRHRPMAASGRETVKSA